LDEQSHFGAFFLADFLDADCGDTSAVLSTRRACAEEGKCTQIAQAVQKMGSFLAVMRVTEKGFLSFAAGKSGKSGA
jgi:hypothetical protein